MSAESIKRPSLYRTPSKEKSRLQRSSSRRNKENGTKSRSIESSKSRSMETIKVKSIKVTMDQPTEKMIKNQVAGDKESEKQSLEQTTNTSIGPQDCTQMDVQTFHVTLTYKPRI